jgi:transposase
MAQALLPDDLWSLIAAYLPCHSRSPKGGRPRVNDRAALTGILFVLKTGIPWEYLPRELGCGSGMTCWRRLHEWMQAGVFLPCSFRHTITSTVVFHTLLREGQKT